MFEEVWLLFPVSWLLENVIVPSTVIKWNLLFLRDEIMLVVESVGQGGQQANKSNSKDEELQKNPKHCS